MNAWFVESFNNMFGAKFGSMADAIGDADANVANEIMRRVYADIVTMKSDIFILKMLMATSDVPPDEVAAKFKELKRSIIASMDYSVPVFGDPESDEKRKAEFDATEPTHIKFILHPETPATLEANTIEGARARNFAGWRNLVRRWFR